MAEERRLPALDRRPAKQGRALPRQITAHFDARLARGLIDGPFVRHA